MKKRLVFVGIMAVVLLAGMVTAFAAPVTRAGGDKYFTELRVYPGGSSSNTGTGYVGTPSQSARINVSKFTHVDDGYNNLYYGIWDSGRGYYVADPALMTGTGTIARAYTQSRVETGRPYTMRASSRSGSQNSYFITGRWNTGNLGS